MKEFPVRVDLLCRFRTAAEQKKTIEDLKGWVDILVGTHRVLSKDVQFKDLGLLIIDEETAFRRQAQGEDQGAAEKHRCSHATATPIPRTLHMSLIGIREIST